MNPNPLKPLDRRILLECLAATQCLDNDFFDFYRCSDVLMQSMPERFRHRVILHRCERFLWHLLCEDALTAGQLHYLSAEIQSNIFKKLKIHVRLRVKVNAAEWLLQKPRHHPVSLWRVRHYRDDEAKRILADYIGRHMPH